MGAWSPSYAPGVVVMWTPLERERMVDRGDEFVTLAA